MWKWTRHSDYIEYLWGTVFNIGDPDVILSCLTSGCGCAKRTAWHVTGRLTCVDTKADDTSLYPSVVPKRYQKELRSLDTAPVSHSGGHEFESPVWTGTRQSDTIPMWTKGYNLLYNTVDQMTQPFFWYLLRLTDFQIFLDCLLWVTYIFFGKMVLAKIYDRRQSLQSL
jgi:hypothetical protein